MCLIYLKFLLTSHQTLGNFGLIKNGWRQRLTNPSDRGLHDYTMELVANSSSPKLKPAIKYCYV